MRLTARNAGGATVWMLGVLFAAADQAGTLQWLEALLPEPLLRFIPTLYVLAFTVALLLLAGPGAKRPRIVVEASFSHDKPTARPGMFVTNVGDKPAVSVMIAPLGSGDKRAEFESVGSLNVDERAEVTIRYSRATDLFEVLAFLEMVRVVGTRREELHTAAAQNRPPTPRTRLVDFDAPIELTYSDFDGRTYRDRSFGLRVITGPAPMDSRVVATRERSL